MAHIREDGRIEFHKITKLVAVQANYIASNQDEHWIDDFIAGYTGLMPWNWGSINASHTEWGCWIDGELWFFSSTSRKELGGKNGTRWIPGRILLRNPRRWKLQEKPMCKLNLINRTTRANWLIGLQYDFYGVTVDYTNPMRVLFSKKLTPEVALKITRIYCSKAVHAIESGRLAVYSPRRQYKWAKKNGFILVNNTMEYLTCG